MKSRASSVFLRIMLGATLTPVALLNLPAEAQQQPQRQGSLELRRIRHIMDGDGNVLLSFHFANQGVKAVSITAVAPSRWGPWTSVHQTVEAGAMFKTLMKVDEKKPLTTLWLSTSEGLEAFQLPSQN